MMNDELFLIDANSLITPYRTYYPFDLAPGFWQHMSQHIEHGSIAVLDIIKSELLKGDDDLTKWISALNIHRLIDHREPQILDKYGDIVQYINNNLCYKPSALTEWSKESVADAWLIAAAEIYNCTIITFEVHNGGLNAANPSKEAKIPDVADVFGVKTQNLYYMIRKLGFSL